MPELRRLEPGFDRTLATAIVGVDTLFGHDAGSESGKDHFIADSYPRDEVELPASYHDKTAVDLRGGHKGVEPGINVKEVADYVVQHGLTNNRERLLSALGANAPTHRQHFARNLGECLDVMARTALAINRKEPLPSYEERYAASTRRAPELVDTAPLRETLRAALDKVGFDVTQSRSLRDTFLAWESDRGKVPADKMAKKVARVRNHLMDLMRRNMFSKIDFDLPGHDPHLADLPFDGMELRFVKGVPFTGSNAYTGGVNPDGSPALKALFEYNTDHPLSPSHLYDFVAHEIIAHYVDTVMADLRWREGQMGMEGPLGTMCTTGVILREGFAQNSLQLIYGGSEERAIEDLGPDQRVQFARQRLDDTGKHNASILLQMRGMSLDDVKRHLEVECVLSDQFVAKLSGIWARHPVWGPMYGPAYRVGQTVVDDMIKKHGPQKVLAMCLHKKGYLDIDTLPEVLDQAA